MIRDLGGISHGGVFYDKKATHCIAPDTGSNCNLSVVAFVADPSKKLVSPRYIRDSAAAKRFLDDTKEEYIPHVLKASVQQPLRQTGGLFRHIRCCVFLQDIEKAERYKDALRGGGAMVKEMRK